MATVACGGAPPAWAADLSIRLGDAAERGTFNVGAADASLSTTASATTLR
jgi:hypothetical protein